ncbi:MAG TPA: hypothetical protein PLS70_20775 [Acidobacteriota bacterium]|nr:hypothetical protein [Acidobacteriota bacterium]
MPEQKTIRWGALLLILGSAASIDLAASLAMRLSLVDTLIHLAIVLLGVLGSFLQKTYRGLYGNLEDSSSDLEKKR